MSSVILASSSGLTEAISGKRGLWREELVERKDGEKVVATRASMTKEVTVLRREKEAGIEWASGKVAKEGVRSLGVEFWGERKG